MSDTSVIDAATDGDAGSERPRSLRVKLALGAGLVVLIVVVVGFATRFGEDPGAIASPLIGRQAPNIDLAYLEKPGRWSLDEMKGKVVVVNFWASWCVACRLEHDDLMAAAAAYRDRDVIFLGIVFQDDENEAIAFLDQLGRGYDSVVDPGSRVAIEYGVWGIPETFFIDHRGVVRSKISGESTFAMLSAGLDEILLGDPAGTP